MAGPKEKAGRETGLSFSGQRKTLILFFNRSFNG
jgi:hypothetical protein